MNPIEYRLKFGSLIKCRCCGIDRVDPELLDAISKLCNVTGLVLKPSCAYRCPKHNAEVGGHPQSRHIDGRAIDILTTLDIRKHARLYFNGVKRYSWGWHLQLDPVRGAG